MIKERNVNSQAPKPLDTPKGDMLPKIMNEVPLDQRIHEYAKQKRR